MYAVSFSFTRTLKPCVYTVYVWAHVNACDGRIPRRRTHTHLICANPSCVPQLRHPSRPGHGVDAGAFEMRSHARFHAYVTISFITRSQEGYTSLSARFTRMVYVAYFLFMIFFRISKIHTHIPHKHTSTNRHTYVVFETCTARTPEHTAAAPRTHARTEHLMCHDDAILRYARMPTTIPAQQRLNGW